MATNITNECPGFGENLKGLISTMFLRRNETSDFHLECEGKRIPCHKIILAAASPVFKAMIRSRMKESQEELMEISNFSFDTIITLVRFIYLKDIKKEVKIEKLLGQVDYFDVLQAADYFQIPLLKKLCEFSLANGMSKENVLDCYSIAKKFNADILLADAKDMIVSCKSDIMKEDGWKKKLVEHPNLMLDLLEVDKNENDQQVSSTSRYIRRKSYLTSQKTGTLTRKTGFFALFQKKNFSEEVYTDMLFSFYALYNDGDTGDLAVTIGKTEQMIHLHKSFALFYSEKFLEKLMQNKVIEDIETDILTFFYTGKIVDYEKKAKNLIELSLEYDIPLIRDWCQASLIRTLNVDNVLERFIFASRMDCLELKKKARKMIFVQNKNILKTENWKELIKENTDIGFELFMEALGILQFQNTQ